MDEYDYDDLSWDKIDEIENELGVEYDLHHGRFVPDNGRALIPGFPSNSDLDDVEWEVQEYLREHPPAKQLPYYKSAKPEQRSGYTWGTQTYTPATNPLTPQNSQADKPEALLYTADNRYLMSITPQAARWLVQKELAVWGSGGWSLALIPEALPQEPRDNQLLHHVGWWLRVFGTWFLIGLIAFLILGHGQAAPLTALCFGVGWVLVVWFFGGRPSQT